MHTRPQPLPFDPATLPGLSEKLLRSHHQNNYGGAVARLNAIRAQLATMDFVSAPGFALNGLKREELIASNSMLLHELYFASLGGQGAAPAPGMALALAASFGSLDRWRDEFVAMGKALGGGSGWVLLMFHPREGRLVNQWAADHTQALAGGVPILALDMYEHAYHLDHGAAAGTYVEAFMAHIDWAAVYGRYQQAVNAASDGLQASPSDAALAPHCIDVRRASVFEAAPSTLPRARWRDPAAIATWADELPSDEGVVVYCVHGHDVSRVAALRLRAAGVPARFLQGGLEGWVAAGQPVESKNDAPAKAG